MDPCKHHPSILKIKSEVSSKSCSDSGFSRNILVVTSDEVEKLLKFSKSKKEAVTTVA